MCTHSLELQASTMLHLPARTADPHPPPSAVQITQKVTEVYLGQRGMLFWANKAAMASSIGLGVAWVLFRLVLPNLGIYQLPGDH
jgi:hypothetical protein